MTISRDTRARTRARARRARLWTGAAILAFALTSLAPRPARAQGAGLLEAVLIIVGVGVVVVSVDSVFLIHDASAAANRAHPTTAWSVTELVLTAPQALAFTAITAGGAVQSEVEGWTLYPAMFSSAMMTHAIWSLAEDPEAPKAGTRFLASGAIGVNGVLSLSALGALGSERHVFTRWMGVTEVVLTLPQVAVGAVELGLDAENRPLWGAFTAWSGALLIHGVTSIVLGEDDSTPEPPVSGGLPARRRAGPLQPRVLGVGPAPLIGFDGRASGMSFVLRGSL